MRCGTRFFKVTNMKFLKSVKSLIFLLLLLAFFSVLPSANYNSHSVRVLSNDLPYLAPEDVEGWRKLIRKIGGNEAYEEFAKSVEGLRDETKHNYIHGFGGVLYEEEGIEGISVCDERFFYGCFHEFVGRAIEDRGLESAIEMNQVCVDSFSGSEMQSCQHGIGHGIQSLYGYTQGDLDAALEECYSLPNNNISGGGCYGGIFMEYNLRTMLSSEGTIRHSENIFSPCDTVDPLYQEACVYWQPQWWRTDSLWSLINLVNMYEIMGGYCHQMVNLLSDESKNTNVLRRSCFGGIGGISAPDTEFNMQYSAELCDAATNDDAENAICKANSGYRAIEVLSVQEAQKVCLDLGGDELLLCQTFIDNNYENLPALYEALGV
jgi:hypothetical protein